MMVPLSDAVLRIVPSLSRTADESGDLCVSTTLMTSSLIVSNNKTPLVIGTMCVPLGGA